MNQRPIYVALLAMLLLILTACGGGATAAPTAAVPPSPVPATVVLPTAIPATDAPSPTATPVQAAASQPAESQPVGSESAASQPAETGDVRAFVIDPAQSEARFLINEVLLGAQTEVKGVTSQITGTIDIDLAAPANTRVSPIIVDARDLKTDRNLRDRAIRRFILQSADDKYQFITFTPGRIEGLPPAAHPGDTFTFTIAGDLQIRDVVAPTTFTVTLTADSESQIRALAQTTVQRTTFDLQIPSAPGVADVSEEVRLELAFVAQAQ